MANDITLDKNAVGDEELHIGEHKSEEPKKHKSVDYGKWGLIFVIPFLVAYLLFTLIPQLLTIGYSFFEYYSTGLGTYTMNWVGLQNYIRIFQEGKIFKYFWNTIVLWVMGAIPQFGIALLLAVIFTSTRLKLKFTGFFKILFYLPNVIMASAFALLFFQIFDKGNGVVNQILVHYFNKPEYGFLSHKVSVRLIIAFMNYLMWFGNTTLVLMAGIQGIDESIFESARIDGANSWQIFKDMIMPLLKPIFVYCFITSLIGGLQMFDVPQILTNKAGTPDHTSTTIVMYLSECTSGKNYGEAGTISVILFMITGVLSLFVFKTTNSGDEI